MCRCNYLLFPEIKLTVHRIEKTREGETFVKSDELEVQAPTSISAVYTIVHEINKKSPLYALLGKEDLSSSSSSEKKKKKKKTGGDFSIMAAVKAMDDTFFTELTALHKYNRADLVYDKLFADVLIQNKSSNSLQVDFNLFNAVKDGKKAFMSPSSQRPSMREGEGAKRSRSVEMSPASSPVPTEAEKDKQEKEQKEELPPCPYHRHLTTQDLDAIESLEKLVIIGGGARIAKDEEAATDFNIVHNCCFSMEVFHALKMIGLDPALVVIDLDAKPKWFTDLSPAATTPVVLDPATRTVMRCLAEVHAFVATKIGRPVEVDSAFLSNARSPIFDVIGGLLKSVKRVRSEEANTTNDRSLSSREDYGKLFAKLHQIESRLCSHHAKFESTEEIDDEKTIPVVYILGGEEATYEDVSLCYEVGYCVYEVSVLETYDVLAVARAESPTGLQYILRWMSFIQKAYLNAWSPLVWPSRLYVMRFCTLIVIEKFMDGGLSEREMSQIELNIEHFLGITTDASEFCAASSSIPKLRPVRHFRRRRRRPSSRVVEEEEESDASEDSEESDDDIDDVDDDGADDDDNDEETHIHHCL